MGVWSLGLEVAGSRRLRGFCSGRVSRLCMVGMGDTNRRNCLQVVSFVSEPEGVALCRCMQCLNMGMGPNFLECFQFSGHGTKKQGSVRAEHHCGVSGGLE